MGMGGRAVDFNGVAAGGARGVFLQPRAQTVEVEDVTARQFLGVWMRHFLAAHDAGGVDALQLLGGGGGEARVHVHDDAPVADEVGDALLEVAEGVVEVAHDVERDAVEGQHDGEENEVDKELEEIAK
jgi:hypothetical protein